MEEQKQKSYITKDMTIREIIELYPETMDVIMGYQLACVGCGIADFETIEGGAMGHGMTEEEVGMLVKDLNRVIEETRKVDIKEN